jgi:hypothetical protein
MPLEAAQSRWDKHVLTDLEIRSNRSEWFPTRSSVVAKVIFVVLMSGAESLTQKCGYRPRRIV